MHRISFSLFRLLEHRSLAVPLSFVVSYSHLSSIPKGTQLRSFINFDNLSSGDFHQSFYFQRFRLQHSMASDSSSQPKSIHDFVVKVRLNSSLILFVLDY